MSFFDGMIYTPGESSACSDAIFTGLGAAINTIDTVKKIYLPYYWPNFQANIQDMLASGSGAVQDCDLNRLFSTVTKMITTEGLTELAARLAGAAAFELFDMIKILGEKTESPGAKARSVGRFLATTLNYHI